MDFDIFLINIFIFAVPSVTLSIFERLKDRHKLWKVFVGWTAVSASILYICLNVSNYLDFEPIFMDCNIWIITIITDIYSYAIFVILSLLAIIGNEDIEDSDSED